MTAPQKLSCNLFRDFATESSTALCVCDVLHRFVWANVAYERIVGFSLAELLQMRWVDITYHEDISADVAGVQQLVQGQASQYEMRKRYIHKDGRPVPVRIIVHRFPRSLSAKLTFLRVEVYPTESNAHNEDEDMQLSQRLDQLELSLKKLTAAKSHGVNVHVGDTAGGSVNSPAIVKALVAGLSVLGFAVGYLYYLSVMQDLRQTPVAPTFQVPK